MHHNGTQCSLTVSEKKVANVANKYRPRLTNHIQTPRMNRTARCHEQNSYAPRSRRCNGYRKADSSEPVNKCNNLPVFTKYFQVINYLRYLLTFNTLRE
jgi:hypothetical protein